MLNSYGYRSGAATAGVVVTSVSNLIATISMPAVAAVGLFITGQLDEEARNIALISFTVGAVSITGLTLVVVNKRFAKWLGDTADSFLRWLHGKISRINEYSIKDEILHFYDTTHVVFMRRWYLLASSNLLQQLSQFSVLYVALQILEPGSIGLLGALWAFSVARLGTFVPLTPGGLGTVDAVMVALLVEGGVSNDAALAATLLWRLATFFPQMAIGAITFLYWRSNTKRT